MKKKIILFACDLSDRDFKRKAEKKLQEAGYEVITDLSEENLNLHLGDNCILIAHVPNEDILEKYKMLAILGIAQKYDIPLFGVKSNEWELPSEKYWVSNGIPMIYYDDLVFPNASARAVRDGIENYCEDRETVIVGYASATLQ